MKRILNKWQFEINLQEDYRRMIPGWKIFNLFLLKVTSFPNEGEELRKENYKGIWIRFMIWFPIDRY